MYCALFLIYLFIYFLLQARLKKKEKEMIGANAAGCPTPSSIPIKLDELEAK